MDKLSQAKNILEKYNQQHLLNLYDELSDSEKEQLLDQILDLDFKQILNLYNDSMHPNLDDTIKVTPLEYVEKEKLTKSEVLEFTNIGEKILKSGAFAVVTMAGGQGTRLGYKGPKGTYLLDIEPKRKSLFEIMCDTLKCANQKYNISIPWFIMTSRENNSKTQDFFKENNFFDYPKDKVYFFLQSELPLVDLDGNLILQEPYLIKEASNGNGDVFNAMQKNGIIDEMEKQNIEWISFGGIDNVLLKNIDPLFLGITVYKNFEIASKSIFKKQPLEKTAVYCRKNGKPAILDYDDISLELSESKSEDGSYLYRDANILSHLMSLDAVKKVANINLKYHRAFKKNAFVNFEGVKQVPDKPNTFKFENFIFDAFSYFDDMLLLRVDENEEFAPIKDFTGIYNPDSAIENYNKYKMKKTKL